MTKFRADLLILNSTNVICRLFFFASFFAVWGIYCLVIITWSMFENIWKYIRLRTCPWSISKTSPSFCSSVLKAPHKNKLWQMWPKYFKLFSKIFYICGNNYTKLLWKQNYLLFVYLREYHHLHLSKFCERFLISHNRLSGNRYPLSPILDISLNLISYWWNNARLQISCSARCRYALNTAHHTPHSDLERGKIFH